MKKKILYVILIFVATISINIIFSGKVEARTSYNSELEYEENEDGGITVYATSKSIQNITIPSTIDGKNVTVAFPERPEGDYVTYAQGEVEELQLAYAMSVHKSQGSEYPYVILLMVQSHYIMLQRNLLYTAVTRAKERVLIVGSKNAVRTAVENDKTKRRYSLLAERLQESSEVF